jgi:hypothetical protein
MSGKKSHAINLSFVLRKKNEEREEEVRKRIPLSVPVFYQLLQEGRRHEEL